MAERVAVGEITPRSLLRQKAPLSAGWPYNAHGFQRVGAVLLPIIRVVVVETARVETEKRVVREK